MIHETSQLEKILDYSFQQRDWLDQARTHRSAAHEFPREKNSDNERLEFLGDAVLDLVISETLMVQFPEAGEGSLSKLRAHLVSEPSLHEVACQWQLGPWLILGHGEEKSGGFEKPALLADLVEALFGAVYLDGGLASAKKCILRLFAQKLTEIDQDHLPTRDFKTALQELLQEERGLTPTYVVSNQAGPAHAPWFEVNACVGPDVIGSGGGRSKKIAAQSAAADALSRRQEGFSL